MHGGRFTFTPQEPCTVHHCLGSSAAIRRVTCTMRALGDEDGGANFGRFERRRSLKEGGTPARRKRWAKKGPGASPEPELLTAARDLRLVECRVGSQYRPCVCVATFKRSPKRHCLLMPDLRSVESREHSRAAHFGDLCCPLAIADFFELGPTAASRHYWSRVEAASRPRRVCPLGLAAPALVTRVTSH